MLRVPTGVVDFLRGEFQRKDGQVTRLTTKELEALAFLADRANSPVSREALRSEVWGHSEASLSRAVDTAMARLRRKLEPDGSETRTLQTVHGTGYCLRVSPAADVGASLPAAPSPGEVPARRTMLVGDRVLDLGGGHVEVGAERLRLSSQERLIIESLLRRQGIALEGDRLARLAGIGGGRGALRNAIYRLRQKLEDDPRAPRFLLSERGGAYRLAVSEPPTRPSYESQLAALTSLTDHVGLVHGVRDCVVYVREGPSLRQVAAHGPKRAPGGGVSSPLVQLVGEGLVGASAASGEPILVDSVAEDPRYLRDLFPASSELSVPVIWEGVVRGVIDCESPDLAAFTSRDLHMLMSLAALVAPSFPDATGETSHG
jgi:DNA-binding response OmpR family regulator